MVYIKDGQVIKDRSPWRFSIILDVFWSIINGIYFFLQTLINPQGANKYKTFGKRSGWDDKKGDGKGPGKGPGPGGPRMSGMGNINTLSDHMAPCSGGS